MLRRSPLTLVQSSSITGESFFSQDVRRILDANSITDVDPVIAQKSALANLFPEHPPDYDEFLMFANGELVARFTDRTTDGTMEDLTTQLLSAVLLPRETAAARMKTLSTRVLTAVLTARSRMAKPPPRQESKPVEESPWAILGLHEGASDEAIDAAYKKRIMENHPDLVYRASEELKAYATERSAKINAAYEALKNRRNR